MEEPMQRMNDLQTVTDTHPVVNMSYVELPERITCRIINLSNILGAIAFLAMIAAPGAVESEMYITAVVLVAIFAVCAHLSIREDGRGSKED